MRTALTIALCLGLGACGDVSMTHQKKDRVYAPSSVWKDDASARLLPKGTVAQSDLVYDQATRDPPAATPDLVARGQERYQIFCVPCHGSTGQGDGVVVQRGFPKPPPLGLTRMRDAPARHFFDVISNGYGVMYPFARIPPEDRWAIILYIRALQLASDAPLASAPEAAGKLR